jgi:hypothetical protein
MKYVIDSIGSDETGDVAYIKLTNDAGETLEKHCVSCADMEGFRAKMTQKISSAKTKESKIANLKATLLLELDTIDKAAIKEE